MFKQADRVSYSFLSTCVLCPGGGGRRAIRTDGIKAPVSEPSRRARAVLVPGFCLFTTSWPAPGSSDAGRFSEDIFDEYLMIAVNSNVVKSADL